MALDASLDPDARELLSKANVDPVQAQRHAQEMYDGEVDWGLADWSNPLLKQLGRLSVLSAHDMPQASHMRRSLRRELPAQHALVADSSARLSKSARDDVAFVPDLEMRHADGCAKAEASPMAHVYGVPSPSKPVPPGERAASLKPLPTLESTAAPPLSDKAVTAMANLVHLSSDLLASDPQLGHIVRKVAEERKGDDPRAAQLLAGTAEVELPDDTEEAKKTVADRLREQAMRPSVFSPNKAFAESDIVAYERLVAREAAPQSMHDDGRETWHQRAIDFGAQNEDAETYDSYREELTQAQGRLLAVAERTEKRADAERGSRPLAIGGPPQRRDSAEQPRTITAAPADGAVEPPATAAGPDPQGQHE